MPTQEVLDHQSQRLSLPEKHLPLSELPTLKLGFPELWLAWDSIFKASVPMCGLKTSAVLMTALGHFPAGGVMHLSGTVIPWMPTDGAELGIPSLQE